MPRLGRGYPVSSAKPIKVPYRNSTFPYRMPFTMATV